MKGPTNINTVNQEESIWDHPEGDLVSWSLKKRILTSLKQEIQIKLKISHLLQKGYKLTW